MKCENAFKVCAGVRLHSSYYTLLIYFPLNSLKGLRTAFLNHCEYIEGQLKKKKDEPRGVRYVKAGVDVAALTSHIVRSLHDFKNSRRLAAHQHFWYSSATGVVDEPKCLLALLYTQAAELHSFYVELLRNKKKRMNLVVNTIQ